MSFFSKQIFDYLLTRPFVCFIMGVLGVSQPLSAQENYRQYYEQVDSAFYYVVVDSNQQLAFEKYQQCFKEYVPFITDIEKAIVAGIKTNQSIDSLICLGFKLGAFKSEVKYLLKKHEYSYKRRHLNQLKRKGNRAAKLNKNRKTRRLIKQLFIKDQFARIFNSKKIDSVDSINATILTSAFQKNKHIFKRSTLGYTYSGLLGLLIFHQGWSNYHQDLGMLISLTESGDLHRNDLIYLFQRDNLIAGDRFEVNEKHQLIKSDKKAVQLCNTNFFASCIGAQLKKINGRIVYTPLDPDISEVEINKLRKALFLPPLYFYDHVERKYRVSIDEYCRMIQR
jgi:hypothetical protein